MSTSALISWGIIGCGNVTEVKSGPAFNKVEGSKLVAVMRRNAVKAEDYAKRHGVPKWYSNVDELINDPEINAVYIATPPAFHEAYAVAALKAGKFVYVEKPVTTSVVSCKRIIAALNTYQGKLCVAHYRRALPLFIEIKKAIERQDIGPLKMIRLELFQPHRSERIAKTDYNWRVVPKISGGGLFFDLAPHQLDLMIWLFGQPKNYTGIALNQAGLYTAEDTITGMMQLPNKLLFSGNWCFTMPEHAEHDDCELIGEKGIIRFAVFGKQYTRQQGSHMESFKFQHPEHIQQPMIQKVVNYFSGKEENPCSAADALQSLQVMESFINRPTHP